MYESRESVDHHVLIDRILLLERLCICLPGNRLRGEDVLLEKALLDDVMPRSRGYGDVIVIYIRRSKISSHIHTLSISTCKNQSTKVRGALYIPIYEYNYKVITGCDTILQEYYITDKRKCENTKRYTIMNSSKSAHELEKKNSRDKKEA